MTKIRGLKLNNPYLAAILVGMVVLLALSNHYFLGYRHSDEGRGANRRGRMKVPKIPRVTPKMIDVEDDDEPQEKLVPVSLRCKSVCTSGFGSDCYPIDLVILVYRDDAPTRYMRFLQNSNPVIYVPEPPPGDEPLPEYREVERCNVDEHFPDIYLIPKQATCALVGNSGILRGSGCGGAIDSHKFVVRANLAPLAGYELDVGTRTSMTAINREILERMYSSIVRGGPNVDNHPLLEYINKLKKSIVWFPKSLHKLYQRDNIRRLAETLKDFKYMGVNMAYSWKSISVEKEWNLTGFATLGFDMFAAARVFCSNITLYGFHPFNEGPHGERIPHHYYQDMDFQYQTAKHDFILEYEILKGLSDAGEIKMQTRKCT